MKITVGNVRSPALYTDVDCPHCASDLIVRVAGKDSPRSTTCDGCSRVFTYVCWTSPELDLIDPVLGDARVRWMRRLSWLAGGVNVCLALAETVLLN